MSDTHFANTFFAYNSDHIDWVDPSNSNAPNTTVGRSNDFSSAYDMHVQVQFEPEPLVLPLSDVTNSDIP